MKTPFSGHLKQEAPLMRNLIDLLSENFDYVSILSTDSVGFSLRVSPKVKRLTRETMTTERGHVVRLYRNSCYFEYAFNDLSLDGLELNVYNFNPRGIRCYEKVGFIKDGPGKTEEDIHMKISK